MVQESTGGAAPPVASSGQDLREAVQSALRFLENAPLESGYCMCGDPIKSHGMHSGHSPVDDLAYSANQVADGLKKALLSAPAVQPGGDLVEQELTAFGRQSAAAVAGCLSSDRHRPIRAAVIVRDQLRNFLADHAPETIEKASPWNDAILNDARKAAGEMNPAIANRPLSPHVAATKDTSL